MTPATDSPKGFSNFDFFLRYGETGSGQKSPKMVEGALSYEPASVRFRLSGPDLNTKIIVSDGGKEEKTGLGKYLNNNDEAFAVALKESDIFYTSQAFYKVDYTYAESRLATSLTPRRDLKEATSEKGRAGKQKTRWDRRSIFHIIDSQVASGLMDTEFPDAEFLFCDDLGTEVADFVAANFAKHKIAFIHAKHGTKHKVSASALHEAVSQAIKNLSVLSRTGAKPRHLSRWNQDAKWSKTKIHRWRRGSGLLPEREALWTRIRTEILDHPAGQREVWLVLGQTLEKESLLGQLKDVNKRTAVTGQVVHLLSSLSAHCTQVAVRLKVFCN